MNNTEFHAYTVVCMSLGSVIPITVQEALETIEDIFTVYEDPSPQFGYAILEAMWKFKAYLEE